MPHLKLVLIRHGTSLGNQNGRMMGQLNDALAADGIAESQRLAQHLVKTGDRPAHVYSSPLRRAVQTAQILIEPFTTNDGTPESSEANFAAQAAWPDLQTPASGDRSVSHPRLWLHPGLKEIRGGVFEGLTWAQAQEHYPELCQQLEHTSDLKPIPGGESPSSASDRVRHFLDELLDRHGCWQTSTIEKTIEASLTIWIISHSGILQYLIAALLGCDRIWGITIPNTAQFQFWLDGDRWHDPGPNRYNTALWQIQRFNDISHLSKPRH